MAKPFTFFSAALISGLALAAGAAATTLEPVGVDVTVRLEGLRSDAGQVICRLYPEGAGFPKAGSQARVEGRIAGDSGTCAFKNTPPGRYAIAAAHDEDGDGRVDRNFLGIPTEGFAFSQDARVRFGPPDFDDAAFDAPPGAGVELRIQMTYL